VRKKKLPKLLSDIGQANVMTSQFVEQRAKVPCDQVGVPGVESPRLCELVCVVKVEKRVPEHLEHGRDTKGQLRICLQVEQQPCGDHVGVSPDQRRPGEFSAENPAACPVRELRQECGREYLSERGKLSESGWRGKVKEFACRRAIALKASERPCHRGYRIAEHLCQQRESPASVGQLTRISVVAVDRPGEVGGARLEHGLGVVAKRLGDFEKRLDHAGTAPAQGGARGCELEGRPGMQHEPQEPVGRRPDSSWIGFLPVRGRHDESWAGLAVAALHVAQPAGKPFIEESANR